MVYIVLLPQIPNVVNVGHQTGGAVKSVCCVCPTMSKTVVNLARSQTSALSSSFLFLHLVQSKVLTHLIYVLYVSIEPVVGTCHSIATPLSAALMHVASVGLPHHTQNLHPYAECRVFYVYVCRRVLSSDRYTFTRRLHAHIASVVGLLRRHVQSPQLYGECQTHRKSLVGSKELTTEGSQPAPKVSTLWVSTPSLPCTTKSSPR